MYKISKLMSTKAVGEQQYGFRAQHSTELTSVKLVDYIIKEMDPAYGILFLGPFTVNDIKIILISYFIWIPSQMTCKLLIV